MAYAVISVIGHDRPGFVRELAAIALENSLNIEETRASGLGSEFAVLMSVTGTDSNIAAVEQALADRLENAAYLVRRAEAGDRTAAQQLSVSVLAMDHPGIVHTVTGFFADRGINIEELTTDMRPAPHTGTPMFDLKLTLTAPGGDIGALERDFLNHLSEEDLDGSMEAIS